MFRRSSRLNPTDDLLTTEEVWDFYRVPLWVLELWRTVGSLDLGRPIYSELHEGVRLWSRGDVEMAAARLINKRSQKSFSALPTYDDGIVDGTVDANKGPERLRTLKWNCESLGHAPNTITRWTKKPVVLSGKRKLQYGRTPVWHAGRWVMFWVFPERESKEIKANLESGKIIDPNHGEGMTREEIKARGGPSRYLLDPWSDPKGDGIPELGGIKLVRWKEGRLREDIVRGKKVVRVRWCTVYSPNLMNLVLDVRTQKAAAIPNAQRPTYREAAARYGPKFHNVACRSLRKKGLLGDCKERRMVARKKGSYEKDLFVGAASDFERIEQRLREADAPYLHAETKETYLPVKPFADLTEYTPSTVEQYADPPGTSKRIHRALGRRIRSIPIHRGDKLILGYLEADGIKIAVWRKTDRCSRAVGILKTILQDGPVLSKDGRTRARQEGATLLGLREALRKLKVQRRALKGLRNRGYYWCLPGQKPPQGDAPERNGQPSNGRDTGASDETTREPAGADNSADNRKKIRQHLPDNPDVLRLAKQINTEKKTGASKMQIALVFTEGNKTKASSLLRELRRYPHLLQK